MKKTMKIVVTAALTAGALCAAACNTVEGIGKDMERGGEKIQESAK